MMRFLAAAMVVSLLAAAGPVPEPDDYRMSEFRAPVPKTLRDAQVLDTNAAHALWSAGEAVFIDVLPRPPRPEGLPEDTIWIDKTRDSIPGAHWLPNVGFGALDETRTAYFRDSLDQLTGGDPSRPIVFFCLAECWMSWNAARRAVLEFGYTSVAWYPDGTDGWTKAGHAIKRVEPVAP